MKYSVLVYSVIFIIFSFKETQGLLQELQMFYNKNCTGLLAIYFNSVNISRNHWVAENATSFKVKGLWQIHGSWSNGTETVKVLARNEENTRFLHCLTKAEIGFDGHIFTQFKKIGPDSTGTAQLLLFTESNLCGNEFQILEDIEKLNENETVIVQSLAQFSNKSWILYPQEDFQGKGKCICAIHNYFGDKFQEMKENGFDFSKNLDSFIVASAKQDTTNECKCNSAFNKILNNLCLIVALIIPLGSFT